MNDRERPTTAETFQEGVPPLQAFVSRGVPIDPQAAASRRGRPPNKTAELLGTVRDGVIVLDDPTALSDGSRVRIDSIVDQPEATHGVGVASFGGAASGPPENRVAPR